MPEKKTLERARRDKREGKSPSTQAGEFVRETMEHIREGKHGARSTKQAIAIGLSKARRAGVKLPPPKKGTTSARTRRSAQLASRAGKHPGTHEIGFDSAADTITLRHVARSREGFAHGALKAAKWILDRKGVYTFEEVLFGNGERH